MSTEYEVIGLPLKRRFQRARSSAISCFSRASSVLPDGCNMRSVAAAVDALSSSSHHSRITDIEDLWLRSMRVGALCVEPITNSSHAESAPQQSAARIPILIPEEAIVWCAPWRCRTPQLIVEKDVQCRRCVRYSEFEPRRLPDELGLTTIGFPLAGR